MIIRKLEALFTINTNAAQFQRATDQLDKFSKKVEDIMGTVAGYWAVRALKDFVANTAKALDEVGKNARFLGITTDALQELRYAAEKSGLSIDGLEDALKELQVRAVDALSGSGEAFESFDKLGVKTTNSLGKIKEPLDLLIEVADQLKELPTEAEKIWVADAIFGDEGAKMRMMLFDGAVGLIRLREEARALGIVITADGIKKAEKFNQALTLMKSTSQHTGNAFVLGLMEPLSWLMDKIYALSLAFNQLESKAGAVRVILTTLAGIVALLAIKASLLVAPLLAPFLPLIGKIALVSILLEDLWGAFKGRDSLIGSVFGNISHNIAQFVTKSSYALTNGFKEAFASIHQEFAKFSDWFSSGLAKIIDKVQEFIAGLMPDFFKDGFIAKIKHILPIKEDSYGPKQLNSRLAPSATNIANQQRLTNNHKVSVSVHVKSGANPKEIGGEVAKAVRQELEKERFNAFMGINQYAD